MTRGRAAGRLLVLVVTVLLSLQAAAKKKHEREPRRPVWPEKFHFTYRFSVPYVAEYQAGGLENVMEVWQDSSLAKQKIVRDGVETVLTLGASKDRYSEYPARDVWACLYEDLGGGGHSGPTRRRSLLEDGPLGDASAAEGAHASPELEGKHRAALERLTFVLPDLSDSRRWVYAGSEPGESFGLGSEGGRRAPSVRVYEWNLSEGGMKMGYKFYVTSDGVPVRLYQLGVNLYTGGHKDEYISDFGNWTEGANAFADVHAFAVPSRASECATTLPDLAPASGRAGAGGSPAPANSGAYASTLHHLFSTAFPPRFAGSADYDRHVHAHGRRHEHAGEYSMRSRVFAESKAFVDLWEAERAREAETPLSSAPGAGDARPPRHRVALNRFADWSRAEWEAMVAPGAGRKRPAETRLASLAVHVPETPPHLVPAVLSWRGTPADSPVKDQGACGSCWTFSTVGSIESAWYRSTGSQQLFSEQNLMDCNWDATNHACFGGEQGPAFDWIFERNQGLAVSDGYPYHGSNQFCKHNDKVETKNFTGRGVLVKGGPEAVKEALYSKGPITVSIDASHDDFRFYAGGLYFNPTCATEAGNLDHAVILSGYGFAGGAEAGSDEGDSSRQGHAFWLIKNMWSRYWGEGGYMRVNRDGNDCGIAAEPLYVELEIGEADESPRDGEDQRASSWEVRARAAEEDAEAAADEAAATEVADEASRAAAI